MAIHFVKRFFPAAATVVLLFVLAQNALAAAPPQHPGPLTELDTAERFAIEFRDIRQSVFKLERDLETRAAVPSDRWVAADLHRRVDRLKGAERNGWNGGEKDLARAIANLESTIGSVEQSTTVSAEAVPMVARIAGTVTDAASGAPLVINVRLFSGAGSLLESKQTNSDGSYSFDVNANTPYTVAVRPADGIHLRDFRENVTAQWDVAAVVDFQLQVGASVSGTVTARPDGGPVADAYVRLYDSTGTLRTWFATDVTGAFHNVEGLEDGTYFAETDVWSLPFGDQLYDGIDCQGCDPTTGTPIQLSAGVVKSGIDFHLPRFGTASGVVREASTGAGLRAEIVFAGPVSRTVYSELDGTFSVVLPPGIYRAYAYSDGHSPQLFDHVVCPNNYCDPANGTAFEVPMEGTVPLTFDLSNSTPAVFGRVLDASSGAPIYAQVSAYVGSDPVAFASTDADGAFSFVGSLPIGTVRFIARSGDHRPQVYDHIDCDDPCDPNIGTPVQVSSNSTIRNVDFQLANNPQIAGTVTDSVGVHLSGTVTIYSLAHSVMAIRDFQDGTYAVKLVPGTYYVRVSSNGYDDELWDDDKCGRTCDFAGATAISISYGSDVNANFVLSPLGSISGNLTSSLDNSPITDTGSVVFYDMDGAPFWELPIDATGHYNAPVPPGTYYVTASASKYVTEAFDDVKCGAQCSFASATPVTVTIGATSLAGFALDPIGGKMSGRITDRQTGMPMVAAITIYNSGSQSVRNVSSGQDGAWSSGVTPLDAGSYFVVASSAKYASSEFGGPDCLNRCEPAAGTPVVITAGAMSNGIDVSLSPVAISGLDLQRGSTGGGTIVSVRGFGFIPGTTVKFGGAAAVVLAESDSLISVATPAASAGSVGVTVTRPDALSFTLPAAFEYGNVDTHAPVLVKSIGTSRTTDDPNVISVGNVFLFTNSTSETGRELWWTDGTSGSAHLLKDINPGEQGSSPQLLRHFGTDIVFAANGHSLWRTDGTESGTVEVSNSSAGTIESLEVCGTEIFFDVYDGASTHMLWISDGTSAGTKAVGSTESTPSSYVQWNGAVYIGAWGIWRFDGTSLQRVIAFDGGYASDLVALNGHLYFLAGNNRGESGLFVSDGTEAGTTRLAFFENGAHALKAVGEHLIFAAAPAGDGYNIWISDGTASGTLQASQIYSGLERSSLSGWVEAGGLNFIAGRGVSSGMSEMWRTDGTLAGTIEVASTADPFAGRPGVLPLGSFAGSLLFLETQGGLTSLRETSGTPPTTLIRTLGYLMNTSYKPHFAAQSARFVFAADGLWSSDASEQNTYTIDLPSSLTTTLRSIRRVGSALFFIGSDELGHGPYLWKSDGSGAGTNIVTKTLVLDSSAALYTAGTRVAFLAHPLDGGNKLYVSDGSEAGTVALQFGTYTIVTDFVQAGRWLFFRNSVDNQWWRTDGVNTYQVSGSVYATAGEGDTAYFIATDATWGFGLWKVTGPVATEVYTWPTGGSRFAITPAGEGIYFTVGNDTYRLAADGSVSAAITVASPVGTVGDVLLFSRDVNVRELWRYDGTQAGTFSLGVTVVDYGPMGPCACARAGGKFAFVGSNGTTLGVFVTDGTVTGTQLLWAMPDQSRYVTSLVAANGKFYFAANDSVNGVELWESDGTPDGTALLADLADGSSNPRELTQLGSRLYFTANTAVGGEELWLYDLGPQPALTSISPTSGSSAGGYTLSATGANFASGMRLTIGGVPVSNPTTSDGSTLAGTVNPLPPGMLLDVAIEEGDPVVLPNAFFSDFLDVPQSHPFHSFVEKMVRNGISYGCGNGNYCVNSPVTRGQMAPMTLRSKNGSAYVAPDPVGLFADVPVSSSFARWVEEFYNEGVTAGCGTDPLIYCPGTAVTRAQTAIFLLRTKEGPSYTPPAATGIFADVPVSSPYAPWIEELYHRGITGGCSVSPMQFCPTRSTTRGQMAVFLTTTFGIQ